jgi:hypothetical protein
MKEDSLWIETAGDPLDDVRTTASRPKAAKVSASRDGHIGCPLSWFRLVFPVVRGKNELAVALWLYRLRSVRHSRTITVSNGPLAEFGIDRFAKYRALRRLAEAGLIRIKSNNRKTLNVRFCK